MLSKHAHFRWVIVALLFTVTVVNYIDRASIAYAIDAISAEFHLSLNERGFILGSFGIGYLVTTFLGGLAVDHYGAKKTLAISIFFWGLGSLLTGVATGLTMVLGARIILGLAEGPNFPALLRGIGDWLPERERNRALSLALISVPISLAIGGPIVTQLIAALTWRGCYYVLTVLALIWIPLWWWLFHDNPKESPFIRPEELAYLDKHPDTLSKHTPEKINLRFLFFNKTLLANNCSFFVFGYYLFFFMTWLPSYLNSQYHLNLKEIGFYSMLPWLCAALKMWFMGIICDKIFIKTKSLRLSRSYPILITQLFAAISILPVIYTHNVFIALFCISMAVGFSMSSNSAFYAVNLDIAKARSGTSLGIMDVFFSVAGFVAPMLTGFIVSWTGTYEAAFILLSVLAVVSSVIILLFHNRD